MPLLSIMGTSLQRSLSFVPKVVVVGRFDGNYKFVCPLKMDPRLSTYLMLIKVELTFLYFDGIDAPVPRKTTS